MRRLALGLCLLASTSPAVETLRVLPVAESINGHDGVPAGLFGVHNLPLDAARIADWGVAAKRVIHHGLKTRPSVLDAPPGPADPLAPGLRLVVDCLFDRYQPALIASHPLDWEERLRALARGYAESARTSGQTHHVEFWNEPYLNWTTRSAVNYLQDHYESAGIAPGGPMLLRGTSEPVPGLEWHRQIFVALNPHNRQPDWFGTSRIPAEAEPGQTVALLQGAGEATLEEGAEIRIYGSRRLLAR